MIRYVESGCMEIHGREHLTLRALLGSCIGVVLIDRDSSIGGMHHIILPEPSLPGSGWNTEIYATTGLPVFIDEICRAGALPERLDAYIAGGALIGTVSEQDLDLDIGGRTVDAVAAILGARGIKIKQSETGGLNNMAMNLYLDRMECRIEMLMPERSDMSVQWTMPAESEIVKAVSVLPPIPQAALRIIRMMDNDTYNMHEVAEEVKRDQVITARVLQLTNSAMTGWGEPVDSVDEAMMILGEKKILRLIVSASLELFYSGFENGYSRCRGTLYHHAIGVAMASEIIAKAAGKADPSVAYTAGLLHDIGKVVLDHFVAKSYPLFYRRTYDDRINIEDAEKEILGISHSAAGAMLAQCWSIPGNLGEVIRCHHRPEEAGTEPWLAHIVYIADSLLYRFSVQHSLGIQDTDRLMPSLESLGLERSSLVSIVESMEWDKLNGLRP